MESSQPSYDQIFSHQRLDVYRVALQFAAFAHGVVPRVPTGRSALREQWLHAAECVVQNIAEGAAQISTPMAKKDYRIALGSAAECAAVLDLLAAYGLGRLAEGQQLSSARSRPPSASLPASLLLHAVRGRESARAPQASPAGAGSVSETRRGRPRGR